MVPAPRTLAALLFVLGSAEAASAQTACTLGKPQQVAELMFGRLIGGRLGVSEGQWAHFLRREITPRFPDGLTVFDARGQWRDRESNQIVREPSKIVQIVLPGAPEDEARLNAIAAAYKSRFRQQSVGIVLHAACVSF